MSRFALLLACYRSGQISEPQWQEHLKDELFRAWLKRHVRLAESPRRSKA